MSIDALYPSEAQRQALVDAVWQCLDDMSVSGHCVCGAAHAQLRIAYEPFKDPEVDAYDDWLSLAEAQRIVAEVS